MKNEYASLDDAALVELMKRGEKDAYSALYLRHRDAVYSYCLHFLRDSCTAQDVVHDTFVRVHEKLPKLDHGLAFRAWVLSIARNLIFNGRRDTHLAYGETPEPESSDRNPLEKIEHEQTLGAVWSSIQQLAPVLREVMELRVAQELSYKEIAEVTGTTEDVVRIRLYRARKALLLRLQHLGEDGK